MKPGRPKLPKGEVRVPFNARVKPATKAAIERKAAASYKSVGRMLDEMFNPEPSK